MYIKRGIARIIKNSRNEDSIEIIIETTKGRFHSSAPSGKSKGLHEVQDYNMRGIEWSKKLANSFLKRISNKNITIKSIDDLKDVELKLADFQNDFGELGGNTTYAIESALLKAAAADNKTEVWKLILGKNIKNIKMPMPVGNCIGGGLHSKGIKRKRPDFQEFELIPDEKTFEEALTKNIIAYFYAQRLIEKTQKASSSRNDENAWNTNLINEKALEVLSKVANKYNLRIGLDVAASSFYDKSKSLYIYKNKSLLRDKEDQIDFMRILTERFNLFYIEDPLDEEDFIGFEELTSKLGKKTLIVGDDLTTTNIKRVERAHRNRSINAMIIKPNQIGLLTEVKKVVDFCKKNNIKTIFSHRSGETMDDILGDYAVGFQADFIKTGIYGRERLIKLGRVLNIERSILNK